MRKKVPKQGGATGRGRANSARAAAVSPASTSTTRPPSRRGKKTIAGHFEPSVSKRLKQLALDRDTTCEALLREALDDLFRKYA